MIEVIAFALIISVSVNLFCYHKTKLLKKQIEELKAKPENQDIQGFLLDLMNGGAVLSIKPINPSDILIRHKRS